MSQMVPDFFDDENTPPGEKDFFNWLSGCPSEWLVFHSLDLQSWNRSRKTEIDFLVVIPDEGILCIEVKSHGHIEVRQGAWYFNGKPNKSPLKQAEDATMTFVRRIRDELPELKRIPVNRQVVFPRATFETPRGIEFSSWELWDMDKCNTAVREMTFAEELVNSLRSSIRHSPYAQSLDRPVSNAEQTKLRGFLRPTFKTTSADAANQELRRLKMKKLLRDQQKPVLGLMNNHERLILNGPAGTGKTLIALEVARVMRDKKNRTGLLCFNRHLGTKLTNDTRDDGPLIVAGSVHAMLAKMLQIDIPNGADSDYWENDFLDEVEETLLDENTKLDCQFDVLILDEAQDFLCRPRLFDLIECLLEGGFSEGKWMFAGDFSYQIFAHDEQRSVLKDKLKSLRDLPRTAKYDLLENCRNYGMVASPGLLLADMDDQVYENYMRGDGNHEFFNPRFYPKERDQLELLKKEIRNHIKRGTNVENIVVLSFLSADKCAVSRITGADIPFKRIGMPGKAVSYGSIHEFKGLENNVVIITDVREPTSDFERDLFYVAMTRALFSVSILVPQDHQAWFLKAIRGGQS